MISSARILPALSFAVIASTVYSQSAWLPFPKELKVTPGFSYSTFDEFWAADEKVDMGFRIDQYTGYVAFEYGILDRLAADATVGYTATDGDDFPEDVSDEGLSDTSLGLRYRVIDEFTSVCPYAPTVSIRVGAVIAGTYDPDLAWSAGDGADAFESSLLLGKTFGDSGFGAYGDIGYRFRENDVPDEIFGTAGIFQQLGPCTLAVGYRHIQSLWGQELTDPSFTFPELEEINQLVEGGVSYTDRGGRNYQVSLAKSVDGRNTGDKWLVGVNISFPLRAP